MNRIFLFFALLLGQIATVQGLDVEGRVAYYIPQDHRVRGIYGKSHGFPEYEVEASCPINSFCDCLCGWECDPCWSGWGNFSIFHKKGRSEGCLKRSTEITNWTINFGIKHYFCGCFPEGFRPYLGFGLGYAHVNFHDHSDFVKNHIDRSGIAILVKSGIQYDIACNYYLNLFADYASNWFDRPSHSKHCVHTRRVNTGGLKLGLGLGYHF